MRPFFREDAVIRWPNTNEQFQVEEFIRANCEYPGRWDGAIERIEYIDDLIITVVNVFSANKELSFHVVSFIKVGNGKILSIDEYWGDDGSAPEWRQNMRIGTKIKE